MTMRSFFALPLAGLILAGCAKSPANGVAGQYTRLRFTFSMADDVVSGDPGLFTSGYLYVVAIRPLYNTDPGNTGDLRPTAFDDRFGPVGVYNANNGNPKNGFVEGRPTRYIVYNPTSQNAYEIHSFGTRTPTTDDQNPVDLARDTIVGSVLASTDPQSDTSAIGRRTFSFDIYTSDLVNNVDNAQDIAAIQFNIIACNKALRQSGDVSGRVADALGNINNLGISGLGYYRANIQTSTTYRNQDSTDREISGDTYGGTLPSVDITDWTLDVARP